MAASTLRRRHPHVFALASLFMSLVLCQKNALAFVKPSCYPKRITINYHWKVEEHSLIRRKTQQTDADSKSQTGASIPNLTTCLVKSIVGGGVLALPAGVAALGDSPAMVLPACALIGAVGAMNAYFFSLIGRVCSMTGATGYREAWEKTVGTESSQWVAIVVALKTALSCLAYSMILADSFQSLAIAAGFHDISRVEALGAVTVLALLPLCLLRDLTSLAPFSLLGIFGMGFTTAAMTIRSIDGSYSEGGVFLNDLPTYLQPSFGDSGPSLSGLVLPCTLATAFVAHYNAPRFHSELQDNTVDRFNTVILTSFAISTIAFMVVAAGGFLTFGAASSGLILNNYSPYDPLVTASRAALALSIVLTFPLPFVGFRDGVLDLLKVPDRDRTDTNVSLLSVALLSSVTVAAALIQDLSFVLSVGGGTFSTTVASVFPTIMFRAAVERDETDPRSKLDVNLALGLMCICVAIGATGVMIAIEKVMH